MKRGLCLLCIEHRSVSYEQNLASGAPFHHSFLEFFQSYVGLFLNSFGIHAYMSNVSFIHKLLVINHSDTFLTVVNSITKSTSTHDLFHQCISLSWDSGKGVRSCPDACMYLFVLARIILILFTLPLAIRARVNDHYDGLLCSHVIKGRCPTLLEPNTIIIID